MIALMAPLLASQLVDAWNWPWHGYVLAYVLFFLTGMTYALITRASTHWAYRLAVGLALLAGFVTAWGTMVHLCETERLVNLTYFGVHAVGAVGAAVARLKAIAMSRNSFAMAAAVIMAWFVTQVISAPAGGPIVRVTAANAVVALAFCASGILFRIAGRAA